MVNGAATDVGYIANNGLAEYGKAVATHIGESVSNTVGYHINTPIAQQLSDLGSTLTNAEYWENFAGGVASIAVAKGATAGSTAKAANSISNGTSKSTYTPKDARGNPLRVERTKSTSGNIKIDAEARGSAHTQIRMDETGNYTKRITFDSKGRRRTEAHYTTHGEQGKSNPHRHVYYKNGKRQNP